MNDQNWQLREGDPFASTATNSLGWEVQELRGAEGWKAVSLPYPTKKEAETYLMCAIDAEQTSPPKEFRVYEALAPR